MINQNYTQSSTSSYDSWSSDDLQCVQAKDEQEVMQSLLQKVNSWYDPSDDLCYNQYY